MQLLIESIINQPTGYKEISILFPHNKLYTYKVTNTRDLNRLKYFIGKGWTGDAVRLIRKFEVIKKP